MEFNAVAQRIAVAALWHATGRDMAEELVDVPEQADERRAAAAYLMGQVLRQQRTQAGLSLRETATLARYDFGWLGRAERGEYLLPENHAAVLDALFDTQGLVVELRRAANIGHTSHLSARLADATSGQEVMLVLQMQGRSVPGRLPPPRSSRPRSRPPHGEAGCSPRDHRPCAGGDAGAGDDCHGAADRLGTDLAGAAHAGR
ncbi:helix-turn-helix transcriptional regulator [Nonomuraea fuscirosea]|uniref:helix-turn-helix transcriptional regulator n=1 Tax=Nonomuraea fuscirosea TaxID=1291556 RepID=UPI00342C1891